MVSRLSFGSLWIRQLLAKLPLTNGPLYLKITVVYPYKLMCYKFQGFLQKCDQYAGSMCPRQHVSTEVDDFTLFCHPTKANTTHTLEEKLFCTCISFGVKKCLAAKYWNFSRHRYLTLRKVLISQHKCWQGLIIRALKIKIRCKKKRIGGSPEPAYVCVTSLPVRGPVWVGKGLQVCLHE